MNLSGHYTEDMEKYLSPLGRQVLTYLFNLESTKRKAERMILLTETNDPPTTLHPPLEPSDAIPEVHWDNFLDDRTLSEISCSGEIPPNTEKTSVNSNDMSLEAKEKQKRKKKKHKVKAQPSDMKTKAEVQIEAQPSFRKQKSATAVKKWLISVDETIPVHNEEPAKRKKLTQSQIANRNGLMKFAKPGGAN